MVSGISELKFEVPKVPKIGISVYQEIRVLVHRTPYGGKDKFMLCIYPDNLVL